VFTDVIVSTDSSEYAALAKRYGAEVPFLRPVELAGDVSPDIEWVEHTLKSLAESGRSYDAFSILRPTSPFRSSDTIARAWAEFTAEEGVDSLRAVERCKQHPGKMWVVRGRRMTPVLPFTNGPHPWHSSQYQSLPEVHVQNASLEMAWTRVVFDTHTIAGHVVMPFFTQGFEGFDVNTPDDWALAERLVAAGEATLPTL
jgi:CMP-N-acetylneuraminic acid synthetase